MAHDCSCDSVTSEHADRVTEFAYLDSWSFLPSLEGASMPGFSHHLLNGTLFPEPTDLSWPSSANTGSQKTPLGARILEF